MSAFARGLAQQGRSIHALILRDMMMRYGRGNVGFVWIVVEPALLTAAVLILWTSVGHDRLNVRTIDLVLTGYMPLTLWRHMTNNVIGLYRNSSNLLYHRQITLLDIIVARLILEFMATTAALFFMWMILYLPGAVSMVDDAFYVLLGWLMMALLGFAFGMIFAALTEVSHTFERFILPIQYISVPLSGCFFLVDWLPTWLQRIAVYNPLINPYEVLRKGYFGDVIVTHYKLDYFFAITAVLLAIGFWSVRAVRHRVQVA